MRTSRNTCLPRIVSLLIAWSACISMASGQEVLDEKKKTNEDVGLFDDNFQVPVKLERFLLRVEPTEAVLSEEEAEDVLTSVENLMFENLKSNEDASLLDDLKLGKLSRIDFDSGRNDRGRRSLTSGSRHFDAPAGRARRAQGRNPSTLLYVDGIDLTFTLSPPATKDVKDWIQAAVNEFEASSTTPDDVTAEAILKPVIPTSASASTSTSASIESYKLSMEWDPDCWECTSPPSPSPSPVTLSTNQNEPDQSSSGSGLTISLSISVFVLLAAFLLAKKRRSARNRNRGGKMASDDSLNRNEFNGLDYIYDMGGSKDGGFPIFFQGPDGKGQGGHGRASPHSAETPPTANPDQLEVAVPSKAESDISSLEGSDHNEVMNALALQPFQLSTSRGVSDVSSLGASDHNVGAATTMSTALKKFPLTNLTRVGGSLYNETNEGFDRLEDAWVSNSGPRQDVPRMLGRSEESISMRYSDTSSISLETEHFYPDRAWDPNDTNDLFVSNDMDLANVEDQQMQVQLIQAQDHDLNSPPVSPSRRSQKQRLKEQQNLDAIEYDDDGSSIGDLLPSVV